MHNQVAQFLNDIRSKGNTFFIEAEGKMDDIENFIDEYNCSHSEKIGLNSEGIIVLKDDANKWGLELRLYVPEPPPDNLKDIFTKNTVYRLDYTHRLNDNTVIRALLGRGFEIGLNEHLFDN